MKNKWQTGQKVEAINQLLKGRILEVRKDGTVLVETDDGFEMTFMPHELLLAPQPSESFLKHSPPLLKKDVETPRKKQQRKVKGKLLPMEVDLHIEKLLKSYKHLSKHDILTYQTDTAKKQLEFAVSKGLPEVVFIHGVGEGVLRAELEFLFGRYKNISISNADYTRYGLGALQVSISQKATLERE